MSSKISARIKYLEADIVVIGGGGAGLAAALAAAENGIKNVIVLEKRGATGGNTAISSGLFAADSPAQKRMGIEFRKDELFKIAMDWNHWKINPRIIRAFIEKSGDTIGWLEDRGLYFQCIPMYPNQDPLVWHVTDGRGAAMMKILLDECRKFGVQVFPQTPAGKLLTDSKGKVVGVVAEQKGIEFKIKAGAVIIATGGYGGNKAMLKKYSKAYRANMKCDGIRHTGDGFKMATEIGAANEGLGFILMSGPQLPNAIMLKIDFKPEPGMVQLMGIALEPNTLWINKRGERYIDESTSYHHYVCSNAVNRQPDNISYTLFDHRIMQMMKEEGLIIGLGRYRFEERNGMPGLERELKFQTKGFMAVEQVDRELCNGCGMCVSSCPAYGIQLDTVVKERNEYSACRLACPAGVDMRRYMYLLKLGKIEEANEVIREFLPFASITGRVCPHFCETECARKEVDEPVNINALERYIADHSLNQKAKRSSQKYKDKIVVVGSGPAGLACAYFLNRMGYHITVFEALSVIGGMLRVGIPEYRLPRKILDAQINYIKDMGVDFKTDYAIGKDMTLGKLQQEYKAVFIAIGNQLSRKITIEGNNLNGVFWGLDFLKDVNLGKRMKIGEKVVVIGGGNVAIDVALTALRLGAIDVQVVCLESGEEMPAYKEEIEQAIAEGIYINGGWGPIRILGNGAYASGIDLMRCTKVFDNEGRFNPSYDMNTTKRIAADTVILAIGQVADLSLIPKGIKNKEDSMIVTDAITLETSLPGVFAGGDVVNGTASVIEAIASGNRAAVSIDRYIRGQDLKKGRDIKPEQVNRPPKEGMPKIARLQTPITYPCRNIRNFSEVSLGFSDDMANQEVQRCMTCGSRAVITYVDDCRLCKSCELVCPTKAIHLAAVKKIEPVVKIADTLDEIARWMKVNPKKLSETIYEYNEACYHGYDPIFAKDRVFLKPLRTPPYYAIRCKSDFLDTIGGIKINEKMEILDKADNPISGAYAAGVVTGGWEADTYNDVMSGTASGFAINSGRIAGENAVEYIKRCIRNRKKR